MAEQATTTTTPPAEAECDTCGGTFQLRPSGRTFANRHKDNGDTCLGRPVTPEAQPAPGKRPVVSSNTETGDCNACSRKGIGMRGGKLTTHKDFTTNSRCVGSLKAPADVPKNAKQPPAKAQAPKEKVSKPAKPKVVLTPLAKAQAKAAAFALSIKDLGWRTEFEVNEQDVHPLTEEPIASVTAVAKRGTRTDVEEMRITWWGAACIGGENRITWTYKDRTVAVRNANACRQRAAVPHETLVEESMRVATRKVTAQGKANRKGGRSTPNLPFDPATVTEEELVDRLVGRAITWHNALADKQETVQIKPKSKITVKPLKSKPGERTVTVFTKDGKTKSFHLSKLVRIG